MSGQISKEDLECIVCTEVPIEVKETPCCGVIICGNCGPKLKQCPNRCSEDPISLQKNMFLQRMVNQMPSECEYCQKEVHRKALIAHHSVCPKNLLRDVIINEALHCCPLYKQEKLNTWFCDGSKMVEGFCAKTGRSKRDNEGGPSWFCEKCDVDFCPGCIEKYGSEEEYKEHIKFFPKEIAHLAHDHKLTFIFGEDLPEQAKLHCYGKYKRGGCAGTEHEDKRFFACFDCKLLICEYCFVAPIEEYMISVSSEYHHHPLHLAAFSPIEKWECQNAGEKCLKPSMMSNFNCKVGYKCDMCKFYSCVECAKSKLVKL
ncbi:unnamed protein product [Moneuplotes crassus]|uniref:RING-type domain-containing protein n=1 Tax=Euplotes crassus TaxID=5936 RepID=A0AAD2D029_EUPCR|nr:unnamed protein product [Moneuplotes crassus]